MKEYNFNELGYFTESACKKIKEALDGKTYMNFKVSYSNMHSNCTLIIATDYDATEEEIKSFFLNAALSTLA